MVELRWVTKEYDSMGGTGQTLDYHYPTHTMDILQYRQWKVRIDSSGSITPLPFPIEWTAWRDVPTGKEDHRREMGAWEKSMKGLP